MNEVEEERDLLERGIKAARSIGYSHLADAMQTHLDTHPEGPMPGLWSEPAQECIDRAAKEQSGE